MNAFGKGPVLKEKICGRKGNSTGNAVCADGYFYEYLSEFAHVSP